MRKTLGTATALALGSMALLSTQAGAAPSPKSNPLTCFDGASEGYGSGTCTRKGSSFTLTNPAAGDYSGVYVEAQSLAGTAAKALNIGFTYSGSTGGGAPRFSIPLAEGGYLFVDTACDANQDGIVATTEPGCIVSESNGYYGPLADAPGTVAEGYSFVIADQPGTYVVSEIRLGRTSPGKIKS